MGANFWFFAFTFKQQMPHWLMVANDSLMQIVPRDMRNSSINMAFSRLSSGASIHFPPNGLKSPASSRAASANLSLIFSPEF
jgi:hypothetical protein